MTISLTPEQEAHIQRLIDSKQFKSVQHVIDYSLHTLQLEDDLYDSDVFSNLLRAKLKESEEDIQHGRVRSYSKENLHELFDDIQRRGMERLEGFRESFSRT
jgi:Arc/MetJ-type ribon-helix-helix transcriptional regulator